MTTRKLPVIAASLALLAFAAVLFYPALFQGKILAPLDITTTLLPPWGDPVGVAKPHNQSPSDAVSQYLPYRIFAEKSLREDGYIGWNPYEMGGYSIAANTMALPGSWPMQLHRWLPFKDAWNLGIIGEFLIAGFGMFIFLRSRKISWLPCLIGAVAFMFNAQFIIWVYHRWALGSFCWMPWILWSIGPGFCTKPITRKTPLLPAFLALALLGGSLQHVAFVVLACGCMAAGTFDFRRPLTNTPSILGWSLIFLLALSIAAFSLVPQIQGYFTNIATGQIRGVIGYEGGITQPLYNALLIPARIWPWLAGDPQSMDAYRLLKSGYMDLNYIGTIPMLLGIAGLFVPKMPRTAKWLMAVGLVIPLTPLVGPLYHRVELLFILGAAWMTAEILSSWCVSPLVVKGSPRSPCSSSSPLITDHCSLGTSSSSPTSCVLPSCFSRNWQRLLITAVAAIGAALLIGTCLPSGIRSKLKDTVVCKALTKSNEAQFGADKKWISSRAREWTARYSLTHPRTAWVYGLLVLGSVGLLLSASGASRSSPNSHVAEASCSQSSSTLSNCVSLRSLGHLLILCATSLELATLFHTWTTFSDPADLHPKNAAIETVRSLAGEHRVLQSTPDARNLDLFGYPNLLASQFIRSISGYESIQYPSALTATKDSPDDLRLSLAGVGLAIQPVGKSQPGTESWPITGTLGSYTLRKNPAVPSAIIAGSGSVPTTPADIGAAFLEATPVRSSLHTPNRWTFETPPGKSWIRIAQNWHEGWQWKIPGGDWNPFRNGSDVNCWIDSIPSGASHIEVQFFPRSNWLTYVSLGATLAWLLLSLVGLTKVGRARRDAPTFPPCCGAEAQEKNRI